MKVSALNRKLLRELFRLKGQILTIALVIASGITSFIALRGTYASLEASRQAYYDRYRFAHVFARVKRAPESLASRIEALPGVARAQTRVAEEVTLPIEGMPRPAYGRLLSLPENAAPATNALCIVQGRAPERGHDDEIVVLKAFADAHRLEPGQRVPAVLGGKLRQLRVVGVALSPEFVYAIRPGAMVDDPTRYAVLWMERTTLAAAFQMEGAFNDVTVRLQPEASETAVRAALDHLLAPYGADGAHGRKEQVSNRILGDELGQLATLSAMIPLVFLGVAAFLVNLVLGRLIRLQRHELATLKAVGYTNREIGWHYLGLVVVVMVPGMLLGLLGGWAFGRVVVAAYGNVFRFPELSFRMSASTVAIALLVSALSAGVGALFAVRSAVRLPPAEAMRPPAPAHYRRSVVERMGLATLLGPTWMMVVREVLRRPFRTLLSSLGIAGAVALLILGRFGWDSISHYFEAIFLRQQRQDLSVNFARPIAPRAVGELRRWPGVLTAEGLRAVPVRARFEQRVRDSVLIGMPNESTLRRLVTRFGSAQELSKDGVVITTTLGQVLGLRLGDRIDLDVLEGDRRRIRPVVDGFLDEANGLQVYAPKELVAELSGDHGTVSSVLLRVDPLALADVERRLSRSPQVIDVADAVNDMQRLRDMNASFIDIWTVVSIVLAASVVFGVNYNNARIALAARSRDLASLRVLGYSRREVAKVLFGGLAIEVALAVPLGLVLGRVWAEQFMRMSLDPETFRWSVTVAPRTYFMAATVAIVSTAASALWVRRSLNDLESDRRPQDQGMTMASVNSTIDTNDSTANLDRGPSLGRQGAAERHREREQQRTLARRVRQAATGLAIVAAVGAAALALRPQPVPVELAAARSAPLSLAIEESGVTRVKDRFVVSAPVAGSLSRLAFEPGDQIHEGDALAELAPVSSPLLDERTRAEAEARLDASGSALGQAKAQVGRATAARELADQELARTRQLSGSGALPRQALEQADFAARMRGEELSSALFAEKIAKEELRIARVALGKNTGGGARERRVEVLAPASGRVLRVHQKSAGVVQAGAPLVEVGNPRALDLVVDLLTTDAVHVTPGTSASITGWGGEPLNGRVSRIEPSGFTRPSALGVDEQRVNVIVALTDPPERWAALGDGYRVEAKLVLWQNDAVLQVPSGAVFRQGEGWAVFRVRDGVANLVNVQVGHRGEQAVEILSGLTPGDRVAVHPADRVKDGVRVTAGRP